MSSTPKLNTNIDLLLEYLKEWCDEHNFNIVTEFPYNLLNAPSNWSADFAIPNIGCFVEYEGISGFGKKGGHTTDTGVIRDINKYNFALLAGWLNLRVYYNLLQESTLKGYLDSILSLRQVYPLWTCDTCKTPQYTPDTFKTFYLSKQVCFGCHVRASLGINSYQPFLNTKLFSGRSPSAMCEWTKKDKPVLDKISKYIFEENGLYWMDRWKNILQVQDPAEYPVWSSPLKFFEHINKIWSNTDND
jgi:hypothetical protein